MARPVRIVKASTDDKNTAAAEKRRKRVGVRDIMVLKVVLIGVVFCQSNYLWAGICCL